MRAFVVVGVLSGIVLLGGCTSSGGGGSSGDVPAAGAKFAPASAAPSAAHRGVSSGSGAKTTALIESRALIRTAELRVAVKSGTVSEQDDRAGDIVLAVGGEIFSDNRSTGKDASASLTLKVPPDSLTDVLNRLAALGSEKARTLSTEDVTQQVADVESRVQSARDSIARLRALYGHATKVADIIAIEGELSTREADLESLEAQQRTLTAQTSMATIHLDLLTAPPSAAPTHKSTSQHGIGAAFVTGWHGFTAAAAWVARAIATALPFLVLLGLIAVAGAYLLRRRPRQTPPPAPAPDPT